MPGCKSALLTCDFDKLHYWLNRQSRKSGGSCELTVHTAKPWMCITRMTLLCAADQLVFDRHDVKATYDVKATHDVKATLGFAAFAVPSYLYLLATGGRVL